MSTDLVPLPDVESLEQYGDPGQFVVLACERAKDWLVQAVEHGDIEQILEIKGQAEAIRIYTAQKQMGKDAELAAAEIVRRAERGIGKAIRAGQERGEIRRKGQEPGWNKVEDRDAMTNKPGPMKVLGVTNHSQVDPYYEMTDGVSDEEFEAALEEAKEEGNLSRANVKRKVKPDEVPPAKRPEHLKRTRHIDPARVVDTVVFDASVLVTDSTFDLLEGRYQELDRDRLGDWVSSLEASINALHRLKNTLKKELTQ